MLTKQELEHLAKDIVIDYGDYITKKELCSMFGLKLDFEDGEISITEYDKKRDDLDWDFLSSMDKFRKFMQVHRFMHLEPTRKKAYKVIRPEDHSVIAMSQLKKHIEKGFKKCGEILDSTKIELLDTANKAALAEAQVKTARLKHMIDKTSLTISADHIEKPRIRSFPASSYQ